MYSAISFRVTSPFTLQALKVLTSSAFLSAVLAFSERCRAAAPFWIYNKKVDKYDIIEDRKRRNKKCLQRTPNTPRNISKQ